jgi:hypothetical protein
VQPRGRVGVPGGFRLYELDLEHGWGHIDQTENGRPKDWAPQPGTVEALKRHRDRFMASRDAHAHVFARKDGHLLDPWDMAEKLRKYNLSDLDCPGSSDLVLGTVCRSKFGSILGSMEPKMEPRNPKFSNDLLARPARFERATYGFEERCREPLCPPQGALCRGQPRAGRCGSNTRRPRTRGLHRRAAGVPGAVRFEQTRTA